MEDKKVQTKNTTESEKTEKVTKSSQVKSALREHRRLVEWYTIPCLLIICYFIYVLPKLVMKMANQMNTFMFALLVMGTFAGVVMAILGLVLNNNNSKSIRAEKDDLSGISNSYSIMKSYTDTKEKKSSDNTKDR